MQSVEIKKLFGKRIKELRKNHNFSQFQLGEKIGINQRQIAQIECGGSFPSLNTIIKLADIFNCKINELFEFEHLKEETILKEEITNFVINADQNQLKILHKFLKIIK